MTIITPEQMRALASRPTPNVSSNARWQTETRAALRAAADQLEALTGNTASRCGRTTNTVSFSDGEVIRTDYEFDRD